MEFLLIAGGGLILLVLFVVAEGVSTMLSSIGGIIDDEDGEEQ